MPPGPKDQTEGTTTRTRHPASPQPGKRATVSDAIPTAADELVGSVGRLGACGVKVDSISRGFS